MKKLITPLLFLLLYFSGTGQTVCDSLYFSLQITEPNCTRFGNLQVTNLHGTGPFTITGDGPVSAGTKTVSVKDACGNIRTRTATVSPYQFDFSYTFKNEACRVVRFDFSSSTSPLWYSVNGSTPASTTTIWAPIEPGTTANIVAKDSCGNLVTKTQYFNKEYFPYIKELQYRIQCDKVDIFPLFYGFNAPSICLYDFATKALIQCKQAPAGVYTTGPATNFFDVDYTKDYYVIATDACNRDSAYFPKKQSAGGSELNPYDWDCNTFTMHVDGLADTVCLYNATTNQLVSCKGQDAVTINPRTGQPWPSGAVWPGLPYGSYYAYIYDPCKDSTFRIDSTVTYPHSFQTNLYFNCEVSRTAIFSQFDPGAKRPLTTSIFYPDGTLATTSTFSNNYFEYVLYPTWHSAGLIKIIQSDACGHSETTYANQPAIYPIRNISVVGGCPGPQGESGTGNIIFSGNSFAYSANNGKPLGEVKIISPIIVNSVYHETTADQEIYRFTNLPSGTYVIQSTVGCYGYHVYDTVTIQPYQYPRQVLNLFKCQNGVLTFRDTVLGGVGPHTLQIISPIQASVGSTFMLMVDTITKFVIRSTDACGNSDVRTFTVSPVDCRILAIGASNPTQVRIVNKDVIIYPNPSYGSFTISFSNRIKQDYLVTVYNAIGQLITEKTFVGVDKKDFLFSSPYSAGVYFVKVLNKKTNQYSVYKQLIR